MLPALEHKLMSNLLLFVDNRLQNIGQGYQNYSSLLYPIPSDVNGFYAYSAPFKQLANDTSVVGAQVLSGLSVNGTYTPIGSGNFSMFNHSKGIAYFNTPLPQNSIVSGNYAIKEFSIEVADKPEWHLLFETKYVSNNQWNQTLSGLPANTKTTPIIYFILKGMDNKPFGFHRIHNSQTNIRAVVIADNEFQRIAACGILQGLNEYYLPMVSGVPFDSVGNCTGVNYSYTGCSMDKTYNPWIQSAKSIQIPQKNDYAEIVRKMGMVDFMISTVVQN